MTFGEFVRREGITLIRPNLVLDLRWRGHVTAEAMVKAWTWHAQSIRPPGAKQPVGREADVDAAVVDYHTVRDKPDLKVVPVDPRGLVAKLRSTAGTGAIASTGDTHLTVVTFADVVVCLDHPSGDVEDASISILKRTAAGDERREVADYVRMMAPGEDYVADGSRDDRPLTTGAAGADAFRQAMADVAATFAPETLRRRGGSLILTTATPERDSAPSIEWRVSGGWGTMGDDGWSSILLDALVARFAPVGHRWIQLRQPANRSGNWRVRGLDVKVRVMPEVDSATIRLIERGRTTRAARGRLEAWMGERYAAALSLVGEAA